MATTGRGTTAPGGDIGRRSDAVSLGAGDRECKAAIRGRTLAIRFGTAVRASSRSPRRASSIAAKARGRPVRTRSARLLAHRSLALRGTHWAWSTWSEPGSHHRHRPSRRARPIGDPGDPAASSLDAADLLRQLVYLPHASVLVAEMRREIVGGALLVLRPSVIAGGYVGTVDLLVVAPDHDADRVTDALLEELLRSAEQQGLHRRSRWPSPHDPVDARALRTRRVRPRRTHAPATRGAASCRRRT